MPQMEILILYNVTQKEKVSHLWKSVALEISKHQTDDLRELQKSKEFGLHEQDNSNVFTDTVIMKRNFQKHLLNPNSFIKEGIEFYDLFETES